jgi:hypothetical protein
VGLGPELGAHISVQRDPAKTVKAAEALALSARYTTPPDPDFDQLAAGYAPPRITQRALPMDRLQHIYSTCPHIYIYARRPTNICAPDPHQLNCGCGPGPVAEVRPSYSSARPGEARQTQQPIGNPTCRP